jgi:hypothetical protein
MPLENASVIENQKTKPKSHEVLEILMDIQCI